MDDRTKPVRIGLALSGGGARGFAHVGVIQELERLHVPLFCVAGTSMGSFVGGWYAAKGDVESLLEALRRHPWRSFFEVSHVPQNIGSGGLFDMEKIERHMRQELGVLKIEDLPVKFMATATSLKTGTEIDFSSGDLIDAVLASSSLPFVFMPRKYGEDFLSDGGILNNLPVDLCLRMGADLVIAVDVGYQFSDFNLVSESGQVTFKPWEIYRFSDALISMIGQTFRKYDPAAKNVFLLHPYVTHIATTDFDRMSEAVFEGRRVVQDEEQKLCEFLGMQKPQKGFWKQVQEFVNE